MTVLVADVVLDNGPQYLKDNVTSVKLVLGDPADQTALNAATVIFSEVTTPTSFTMKDGATDGRKCELNTIASSTAQNARTQDAVAHYCWSDGTALLFKTQETSGKAYSVSDTDQIPAHGHTVRDATAV